MNKNWFYSIFTILIEVGISLGISFYFNTALVPVAFFIGLLSIGIILYFKSSGGILTNYNNAAAQAQTGIPAKHTQHDIKLKGSPALWGTAVYFLVSLILFVLYLNGFI
ncbi:MAG: hypothetical protein KBT36_05630 [Kurthia sp.]|nr:hypothetical protein [Candidatus Kurthia equi]